MRFTNVPRGLYEKPFVIKFDDLLHSISEGEVTVNAYNVYTVGNYDKNPPGCTKSVTNFLDPASIFKDTWFGVYVILDDQLSLGRRFILKNPHGMPGDLENLNDNALLRLPELDQKMIVWSSRKDQKDYSWEQFNRDFYFDTTPDGVTGEFIIDSHGRSWRKLTGEFNTIAALTDRDKTRMGRFTSIRSYMGLPTSAVYEIIRPWHPVVIKGSIVARYFSCHANPFWALAYYNGSAFTAINGERIDNWKNSRLRKILEKMFSELDVGPA